MKKKFIFIIALFVFSGYYCQKTLLYPVSQTAVAAVDGAPFSSLSRIQAQVLGLYTIIRNGQLYGGRYQVYNDVKADNWINATANSVTAYQTWTETINSTSSEVLNLWLQCYLAINDCNLFIDGMKTYGTTVTGTTLATNYVAEAKFIRALSYNALLTMYCQPYAVNSGASPGVPLRLTGNSSYGDFALAPSTVAQVYTQIISDLNDAETGLPLSYSDAATNTIRAHRNTAIALKTRVYLAMQQYENVITEADKIVTKTAPFTATSGVANALQAIVANVFKTYTTTESIFSMPFVTSTEPVGTQNALGNYFNSVGSAEFYLNPDGVIADAKWKTTDTRRGFVSYVASKAHTYLTKWPLAAPYIDWANVMRYPEVLLNLAEARARSTNSLDAQAIALLNAVRQRSDATTSFTVANLGTASALIAAILQERNIEFLGEGLRWNDLWRLQLPIPAKGGVTAVPVSSASYIWPMSGNEQQYNSLIGR